MIQLLPILINLRVTSLILNMKFLATEKHQISNNLLIMKRPGYADRIEICLSVWNVLNSYSLAMTKNRRGFWYFVIPVAGSKSKKATGARGKVQLVNHRRDKHLYLQIPTCFVVGVKKFEEGQGRKRDHRHSLVELREGIGICRQSEGRVIRDDC